MSDQDKPVGHPPGGWIIDGIYVPDPAYWIAQFVEQTACKQCKGAGTTSHSYLGSRSSTKCDACGGKGR